MSNKSPESEADRSQMTAPVPAPGLSRRMAMGALGLGALAALGAGSAGAKHAPPHTPHIDPYYGYAAPVEERLPRKLSPDHAVGLHIHPGAFSPVSDTDLPFHFSPMGLHIQPGDIVRFDGDTPEHTVTAYHEAQGRQQRVPDSVPPFTSPVLNGGGFWLYRFDQPGTYDLFCAPHEFFGMVMRIVVGDPESGDYDGEFGEVISNPPNPPEPRPPIGPADLNGLGITTFPFPTAAEVLGTNALTDSNIVKNGPISVDDVQDDLESP